MRKFTVYALTAATAMTMAGISMPAYAAVNTYKLQSGNQKMIVIGGQNCDISIPGLPGINIPGGSIPAPEMPEVTPPSQDNSGSTAPDQETGMDAFAAQVVELVNEERAKAGLSPLRADAGASRAALVRSKELQTSFSHTRPNGSSFSTALDAAGVSYRSSGENIAYGQRSPEQVMKSWMNSAGHRANILNPDFTAIGVGHVQNGAGVDYWTQLFIR